jgi:hypothetical protein
MKNRTYQKKDNKYHLQQAKKNQEMTKSMIVLSKTGFYGSSTIKKLETNGQKALAMLFGVTAFSALLSLAELETGPESSTTEVLTDIAQTPSFRLRP